MGYNSFPIPNVQRPSRAQQCCLRPINSGSTAITENNQQRRYFDDMFDPFTNLYQRTNFVCRSRNNQTVPIATQGSGAIGKVRGCRSTQCGKTCNPPESPGTEGCCPADGNPNNYTLNTFEAQQRRFDDLYNPMTDIYQRTNTICRSRTATGFPVATLGSGSFCRKANRRCANTDISTAEEVFDNNIRLSTRSRRQKK